MSNTPVILGSRSPRRRELLGHLVPPDAIHICAPRSVEEAGFEDLTRRDEFDERVIQIARDKLDDVLTRIEEAGTDPSAELPWRPVTGDVLFLTGDTTVIATAADGSPVSLGQPPEQDTHATVRRWFREYFAGKTHEVLSGVCLAHAPFRNGQVQRKRLTVLSRVCATRVTMRADSSHLLDWYLTTGESRGKAGGYAIQGAASVFVTRVEGSLSNVVGLPLEETLAMLNELESVT